MPYIKQEARERLTKDLRPVNSGELNYVITCRLLKYLKDGDGRGWAQDNVISDIKAAIHKYLSQTPGRYDDYNSVVGALECARLEVLRRFHNNLTAASLSDMLNIAKEHLYDDIIAPYEDKKIKENGDVY